ncbi:hypothetical protein WEH80_28050 [Actinomycetes bacterium KLBMP 9759]
MTQGLEDPGIDEDGNTGDGVGTLTLLTIDGALIGGFGLGFTPLHVAAIPVPIGAVVSMIVLPWLVLRAGEIDQGPSMAGAPLWAWLFVIGVLGLAGPGGDVLLPPTWQSALLVVGGLATGLWALRTVLLSPPRMAERVVKGG